MASIGRFLVVAGLVLAGIGALVLVAGKIGWIGRLPGDFTFRRGNITFYFPLATSLVVSAVISLIFWLFRR